MKTALLLVALATPAAASDAFLKLEGLLGDSTAPGHEGWIEVETSIHSTPPYPTTIGVTAKTEKAAEALRKAAASAKVYTRGSLEMKSPGGTLSQGTKFRLSNAMMAITNNEPVHNRISTRTFSVRVGSLLVETKAFPFKEPTVVPKPSPTKSTK